MHVESIKGIIPYTDKKIDINIGKKNLILTGKNGCGKTQLLESIFEVLIKAPNFVRDKNNLLAQHENNRKKLLDGIKQIKENIANYERNIVNCENNLENNKRLSNQQKQDIEESISNYSHQIERFKQQIAANKQQIESQTENIAQVLSDSLSSRANSNEQTTKETVISYHESENEVALVMFFDAARQSGFQPVQNITSLETETNNIKSETQKSQRNKGRSNAGAYLEKFLANWEITCALNERDKDFTETEKLEAWKKSFVSQLRILLDDSSTNIKFINKTRNYLLTQDNKMDFTFRDLSAGYSSILKVFTELLMTVEVSEYSPETICGFVVIDEIDAHLHPSLQRKVLPFFSNLFPKIQFIVSTHSPFVISSESDAVIYDLSTRTLVDDDLRTYSTDVILEAILEVPNYSVYLETLLNNLDDADFVKDHLTEIKTLIEKSDSLSDESQVQLLAAYRKFKKF